MELAEQDRQDSQSINLRRKFSIIIALAVIIPFAAFTYIIYSSGSLSILNSHMNLFIFAMTAVIALGAVLILHIIFSRVADISSAMQKAELEVKSGKQAEINLAALTEDTTELRGIADSFNNLLLSYQKTSVALSRRALDLLSLKNLMESASKSIDMDALLNALLDRAMDVCQCGRGSVFLIEDDQQHLRLVATKGLDNDAREGALIPISESPACYVMQEKRPLIVKDIETDPRFQKRNSPQYASPSFMLVPIIAGKKQELIGTMNLSHKDTGTAFEEEDLHILTIMINEISFAIENSRLFKSLKEHADMLEQRSGQLQREIKVRKQAQQATETATQAKSKFIAQLSHELRNPLSVIMGFTKLLASGKPGPLTEKQEKYLNDMSRCNKYITSLINDTLDLSKVEAGQMRLELSEVNPAELIADVLGMFSEQAERNGIVLESNYEEGLSPVMADQRKLKQVLCNLLSNAVKFTPTGGSICLQARQTGHEQLPAADLPQGSYMEFAISDTGMGICPADQEKLFQPFQQLDSGSKHKGTGLGLALSKQFVELHGGCIWLESKEAEGSTFSFAIPRQQT